MKVLDRNGNEVKRGDIVWRGRKPYIFISCDGHRIEAVSTDDRRMFMWFLPHDLNLTLEAE